jgi:hypothetical protein
MDVLQMSLLRLATLRVATKEAYDVLQGSSHGPGCETEKGCTYPISDRCQGHIRWMLAVALEWKDYEKGSEEGEH